METIINKVAKMAVYRHFAGPLDQDGWANTRGSYSQITTIPATSTEIYYRLTVGSDSYVMRVSGVDLSYRGSNINGGIINRIELLNSSATELYQTIDNIGSSVPRSDSFTISPYQLFSGFQYRIGNTVYYNFEGAYSRSDTIYGNSASERLIGNGGNDVLYGGSGDDTIFGDSGNDILYGEGGVNILSGGMDDDFYVLNSAADTVVELENQGRDTVYVSFDYNLSQNVEQAVVLGNIGVSINGNGLDNALYGGDGNDIFHGGKGDDYISGGAGSDILYGEEGSNTLLGGIGDDYYVVNSFADVIIEFAGEGRDTVYVSSDYALGANIEQAVVSSGSVVSLTGNDLDNVFYGNDGVNTFNGAGGNDYLVGGKGADYFVFLNNGGRDTVADFLRGEDKLAIDQRSYGDFAAIQGRISQVGSDTLIQLNQSNSITLSNVVASSLRESDFLFV
ncbi:calcium-binding protein [Methylobacterium aquaticum]|uniref:calcium-binding protein n=1 Tax=Methylobacterium aquaticum TaxID=270351 RepID=UPI001933C6A9|nr:calcium-binding protein [Methylobacterium aquaticum]